MGRTELKVQYLKKKGFWINGGNFKNQEIFVDFKTSLNKLNNEKIDFDKLVDFMKNSAIQKTTKLLEKIAEFDRILSILENNISLISSSFPLYKSLLRAIILKLFVVGNISLNSESFLKKNLDTASISPIIISLLSIFREEIMGNKKSYISLLNTWETIKIQKKITKEDIHSLLNDIN